MADFSEVKFSPGEIVFEIGDAAEKLYFVKSGELEVLDESAAFISKVTVGQSFGEQAFIKGGVRGATLKAITEVICIEISSVEANALLAGTSSLLVPVFEALLLQQNMSNDLILSERNLNAPVD
jgi:CRP-like cAMP-binding protein